MHAEHFTNLLEGMQFLTCVSRFNLLAQYCEKMSIAFKRIMHVKPWNKCVQT